MFKDIFVDGNGGWLGAAARYGVAIVLALVFGIFLVARVEAALTSIKTTVESNGASIAVMRESEQETLKLLRQTCINTAKNDVQLSGCF